MFCPSCAAPASGDAPLCGCGAVLPQRCTRCGQPVAPGSRFCTSCGHAAPGPAPDELRTVTILFADVVGSTELAGRLAPDALKELMSRWFDAAGRIVRQHGGVVDKYIGDAVMALFGAPIARGDDATHAVRAALALQAETAALSGTLAREGLALRARVGLHTGRVAAGTVGAQSFTVMGEAVAIAKRLESAAPVGGVLVSGATFRLVRGAFDAWAREPVPVKGREEPVEALLVEGEREDGEALGVADFEGLQTPLVGREAALNELHGRAQEALLAGRATVLRLRGDAGLGKSRLVHALLGRLEGPDGPLLLQARGAAERALVPWSVLGRLLHGRAGRREPSEGGLREALRQDFLPRRRRADAGDAGERRAAAIEVEAERRSGERRRREPPTERELDGLLALATLGASAATQVDPALLAAGAAAFARWLQARADGAGALLVIEDEHDADEASRGFFEALAGLPAPLFVLLVSRAEVAPRSVQTLLLEPLEPAELHTLLAAIFRLAPTLPAPLAEAIVAGAAGSPRFLEELVREALEQGLVVRHADVHGERWSVRPDAADRLVAPPSIAAALEARLDRLPVAEREALRRAAVQGARFLVEGLPPSSRAALPALVARGLVRLHGPGALAGTTEATIEPEPLAAVARAALPTRTREAIHVELVAFLRDAGAEELPALQLTLARQLVGAGDLEAARRLFARAAEGPTALLAPRAALASLQEAIALQPPPDELVALRARVGALESTFGASA